MYLVTKLTISGNDEANAGSNLDLDLFGWR